MRHQFDDNLESSSSRKNKYTRTRGRENVSNRAAAVEMMTNFRGRNIKILIFYYYSHFTVWRLHTRNNRFVFNHNADSADARTEHHPNTPVVTVAAVVAVALVRTAAAAAAAVPS